MRRLLGWVAVASLAGFASGCDAASSGLTWPNPGGTRSLFISYDSTLSGQSISFGGLILCMNRPGTAIVQQIVLVGPRNIVVQAFAVRPDPMDHGGLGFGDNTATLDASGFTTRGQQTISTRCYDGATAPRAGEGTAELGIQVARTGTGAGTTEAILVRYRVGQRATAEVRIPFQIILCPPGDPPGSAACPLPGRTSRPSATVSS